MAHEKRGARLRLARPTGTRPACARLAYATTLALTAALAVGGCASAPAGTTTSSANVGSAPALTQATALQAFDAYVAASNQAAATNDGKLALSAVTGVQQSLVSATLKSHAVSSASGDTSVYSSTLSISPALVQYSYGAPTFYLPEPSGYPRFFLADVTRALALKSARPGGTDATTSVGGARVPADGPVLMVFEQSAATGPWQLGSVAQFPWDPWSRAAARSAGPPASTSTTTA